MKSTWPIVAGASAMLGLLGCGGAGFTVVGNDAGSLEGGSAATPDATLEASTSPEGGPDSSPDDVTTTDESTSIDATAPDATSDATTPDAAPEGSVRDAASNDAEWVPDAIEPPPAHCDNGFSCSPAAPDGWSGPLELYGGPTPPTTCSTYFEGPVFVGGSAPVGAAATCGCTCPAPTGGACGSVDVPFFAGLTCPSGGACAQKTFLPGVCTHTTAGTDCDAGTTSMIIPLSAPSGGQCTPVPTKTVPPPAWGVAVRACISALGDQTSDCGSGNVCTHLPLPPFSDICIAQAGVVAACPTGQYTSRRIYTAAFDDTRSCSACTCGPVTGATCTSQLDVFATPPSDPSLACMGSADVTYIAPQGCSFVPEPADVRLRATLADTGSCTASPVAATGALVGAQATTFCCLP